MWSILTRREKLIVLAICIPAALAVLYGILFAGTPPPEAYRF